mmetsp:Transcript_35887/g.61224  ORF Transcript_35887/g.61224 Transcript_35887/m.61224 type:complete len:261 (-) Transcript_35887:642-1424(-)
MFIVPQEKSTFDNLEMIRVKASCKIGEESLADLVELVSSKQLKDFLQFIEEEHLFARARPGPAFEESIKDGCGSISILLNILNDTVGQLLVVQSYTLGLVEGDQCTDQELQVLLLQRNGKSINDGAQNFKQFSDSIMTFCLIDKAVEHIGNGPADERPVRHELSINSVKDCLQVVTLTRILRIKQLHKLEAEPLIHILLGSLGINFRANNEAEEEFIGHLEVRPCRLEYRLIFLRIKVISSRGEGTADIGGDHGHQVRHD